MNIQVTFIPARPRKPSIDFAYFEGKAAKRMIEALNRYGKPYPGKFYPDLGLRVDRISED